MLVEFYYKPKPPVGEAERQAAKEERRVAGKEISFLRVRARRALQKAIKETPTVRRLLWLKTPIVRRYYSVRGRGRDKEEHMIVLWRDRDARWIIDCSCPAGNPPVDADTQKIKWHPVPCYHAGAVLLEFVKGARATEARQRKFNGGVEPKSEPRRRGRAAKT